jgi:hypothetical protein
VLRYSRIVIILLKGVNMTKPHSSLIMLIALMNMSNVNAIIPSVPTPYKKSIPQTKIPKRASPINVPKTTITDGSIRYQKKLQTIGEHLTNNFDDIQSVRVTVVFSKPTDDTHIEIWRDIVHQAYMHPANFAQHPSAEDFQITVNADSSTAKTFLNWKKNDFVTQGYLEVTFAGKDCCKTCSLECACSQYEASDRCGCGKPPQKPPVPQERSAPSELTDVTCEKCPCGKPRPNNPNQPTTRDAGVTEEAQYRCGCGKPPAPQPVPQPTPEDTTKGTDCHNIYQ